MHFMTITIPYNFSFSNRDLSVERKSELKPMPNFLLHFIAFSLNFLCIISYYENMLYCVRYINGFRIRIAFELKTIKMSTWKVFRIALIAFGQLELLLTLIIESHPSHGRIQKQRSTSSFLLVALGALFSSGFILESEN